MIAELLLIVIATVLLVIAGGAAGYHLLLALLGVSLIAARKPAKCLELRTAVNKFVVLIPAHNEMDGIAETLRICQGLRYPKDKLRIIVVADNCSDDTAPIVWKMGVTCWERTDEEHRGKGQALKWAFTRLQSEEWDAVVVLDADCQIDAHAIHRFDQELMAGHQVLQANNVTGNPDEHAQSYLLAIANVHENELFYAPKSAMGLAVVLRGTGMVFRRDVLQRIPWNAGSVAEDAEYGYHLLAHEIPVRFISDTCVRSPFPASREQLVVQRTRWIKGGSQIASTQGRQLLQLAVKRRSLRLMDAALNFWLISNPLLLMQAVAALAVAFTADFWLNDEISRTLLVGSLAVITVYAAIALTSVFILGLTVRRASFWIFLPGHVVRYLILSATLLRQNGPLTWERTPRRTAASDEPSMV